MWCDRTSDVCQNSICFPSIERHRDLAAAAIRYRESVFIIAIIITSSGDNNIIVNIVHIIVSNGNEQYNLQRGLLSLHPWFFTSKLTIDNAANMITSWSLITGKWSFIRRIKSPSMATKVIWRCGQLVIWVSSWLFRSCTILALHLRVYFFFNVPILRCKGGPAISNNHQVKSRSSCQESAQSTLSWVDAKPNWQGMRIRVGRQRCTCWTKS